ncbi:MAG: hypothetical protein KDA85_13495, partial [Planctomycetaceae bacterium]|nr:hypothetical protein [Planctomycetaceae bacterium]
MRRSCLCFQFVVLISVLQSGVTPAQDVGKGTATGSQSGNGQDFAAVINRHFGQGIAAEDNALVLLYEALGPKPEGSYQGDEFFQQLGMAPPAEEGNYFQDLAAGSSPEATRKAVDQLDQALARPWQEEELPAIAEWIHNNQAALQVISQAVQRKQWYYPVVPQRDEQGRPRALITTILPHVQQMRSLARCLLCRANLQLKEHPEQAWHDLLVCHRLGRLTARGPTLIDYLVGVAINAVATNGELLLLAEAELTPAQLQRFAGDLRQLPPMPAVAESVDVTERMMFMDTVQLMSEGRLEMRELIGDFNAEEATMLEKTAMAIVDWDVVRQRGSKAYDKVVQIMKIDDPLVRQEAIAQYEQVITSERQNSGVASLLGDYIRAGSVRGVLTDKVADSMIALLMPAFAAVENAQLRCLQTDVNLQLAFALKRYAAANGSYPAQLNELVPEFAPAVPPDLFSGKPLIYSGTSDGFLLYSVGQNGQDDGGLTWDDEPVSGSTTRGDDLV